MNSADLLGKISMPNYFTAFWCSAIFFFLESLTWHNLQVNVRGNSIPLIICILFAIVFIFIAIYVILQNPLHKKRNFLNAQRFCSRRKFQKISFPQRCLEIQVLLKLYLHPEFQINPGFGEKLLV